MSKSRLLSLVVAGIYILIAYFGGRAVEGFTGILGISLILGLLCIWFGDELGGMVGYLGHGRITSRTPGEIVRFVGWLLLALLPIIGYILHKSIYQKG